MCVQNHEPKLCSRSCLSLILTRVQVTALLTYTHLAEQGYEVAQSNAALLFSRCEGYVVPATALVTASGDRGAGGAESDYDMDATIEEVASPSTRTAPAAATAASNLDLGEQCARLSLRYYTQAAGQGMVMGHFSVVLFSAAASYFCFN